MEVRCDWREGMQFTAVSGSNSIAIDAKRPFGKESALNPKELVLAGLGACTGMDIAAWLRKHKQGMSSLRVVTAATMTEGKEPITFQAFHLTFEVTGSIDPAHLLEAVHLSQTKHCGVSALAIKAGPILYRVILNQQEIGTGQADFSA